MPRKACRSACRPSPTRLAAGRICLSSKAAERALRGIALGRKSWLFCGCRDDVQGRMNDVDPQAWFADFLARIAAHPVQQLDEFRP
ncbi:transposase domain-containing protein [Bradyrhizobium sp. B117]|uniref:transposase domain-containing protein n=1 Tax=Bradyrhizobium sp. B117 TaxID=3140246 RepID=UPI003184527D